MSEPALNAELPRPPVIETDALTRRFGDVTVVDGVSLSVAAGSVCGLLGRNGAGKTTIIKILTTLLEPTSGSARVAGFDVRRQPRSVRRMIGYVPQALSADADLTAYENLKLAAVLYDVPAGECEQRIADALAMMDLGGDAHRLVKTFSGGMIRRLEIAQSTLHEPRVLFLDEPTVGLDPLARQTVWSHVRQLRERRHCAVLITTHYMDEADHLCDTVAILHRGRLAATGTPAELKARLGGAATLDDVFAHYTASGAEAAEAYRETGQTRQVAGRLG